MMNQYILMLKQYTAEYENNRERMDACLLTDLFGVYYRSHDPVDSDRLKNEYPSLTPIVQSLSQKRGHRLQRLIVEICDEYRQNAFLDGLRLGTKLLLELLEEKSE